jgi:DnaK suppressor protein
MDRRQKNEKQATIRGEIHSMREDLDLKHFRQRLIDDQASLEITARERQSAGATVELDQQRVGRLSRMDALQMQAMAQAEARRAQFQLRMIAAALKRIETGEFGYCQNCDEEIAIGRLEANPSTPLCIGNL